MNRLYFDTCYIDKDPRWSADRVHHITQSDLRDNDQEVWAACVPNGYSKVSRAELNFRAGVDMIIFRYDDQAELLSLLEECFPITMNEEGRAIESEGEEVIH